MIDKDTDPDTIVEALQEKTGAKGNPKVANICEKDKHYNLFIDLEPAALKDLFPEGTTKTRLQANYMIYSMEIARNVRLCFRCGGYGHLAQACEAESPQCTFCAGPHERRQCPNQNDPFKKKCLHCDRTGHAATELKCPLYARNHRALLRKYF
jgi:hypothetical protein